MTRVALALLAALLLGPWPALAQAAPDCEALPAAAQRAHACNPRERCLAQVEGTLKGPALAAARRDCQRMPTSGTCYGPDTFNPQAECREQQAKKK